MGSSKAHVWAWPNTHQNITNLPLSNPLCGNKTCLAFAAAAKASKKATTFHSQILYGQYVSMYYCSIIAIFSVAYGVRFVHSRRMKATTSKRPSMADKAAAAGRSLSYRRLSGRFAEQYKLPSLGVGALIFLSMVFAAILCFAEHPYYREHRGYGAPPLGVRAAICAAAMTPIMFALSGKYNLVTTITGISHEKLNVLHRWGGVIYLFFAIVHVVGFVLPAMRDGGAARLAYQFYHKTKDGSLANEYKGIAPLVGLIFTLAVSNPWLRKWSYELFVHSHIAGAIAFLGALFWHADDLGGSWRYLQVTVAIWSFQLLARAVDKTSVLDWFRSSKNGNRQRDGNANIHLLEDETGQVKAMRITIAVALKRWSPGQHMFLRFPNLGLLDNHPFTVASIPREKQDSNNQLVFFVKPHGGLTKRLAEYATSKEIEKASPEGGSKSSGHLRVLVDGPYGGIQNSKSLHQSLDQLVLVAGGSGISAILPWLLTVAGHLADEETACRVQKVNLIWCIRDASAQGWIENELKQCLDQMGPRLKVDIYVTNSSHLSDKSSVDHKRSMVTSDLESDDAKEMRVSGQNGDSSDRSNSIGRTWEIHDGRPALHRILEEIVGDGRSMVIGCGPESLKIALSNSVAQMQSGVLSGKKQAVSLHTETFGW